MDNEWAPGGVPFSAGEPPRMLPYEAAAVSDDLHVRTVATILDAVCALARVDAAVFYVVDNRLRKYAAEPMVAKVNQTLRIGIDEALREYQARRGKHDLFAPSRVARRSTTVLTCQDVGVENACLRRAEDALFFPVAEMYLRTGRGQIVAGIALFRDPPAPDLAPHEVWMLRDLHGLYEHCYMLATG